MPTPAPATEKGLPPISQLRRWRRSALRDFANWRKSLSTGVPAPAASPPLIEVPLYFCRFLKLGVSNAFVIDEAQLEFKMRTQTRLEKISTAISLFGMAMGFSVLGFLIVVNQHEGGASIPGGILAFCWARHS